MTSPNYGLGKHFDFCRKLLWFLTNILNISYTNFQPRILFWRKYRYPLFDFEVVIFGQNAILAKNYTIWQTIFNSCPWSAMDPVNNIASSSAFNRWINLVINLTARLTVSQLDALIRIEEVTSICQANLSLFLSCKMCIFYNFYFLQFLIFTIFIFYNFYLLQFLFFTIFNFYNFYFS